MLTIFAIPKPFRGHIAVIQRNAIRSWTLLHPNCEVILFGDDEGTAQVAAEMRVRYVPHVARNEYGTPLVNNLFEQAQRLAIHSTLCYINADIVLMNDFVHALNRVVRSRRSFLMVGRRWNLDIEGPLDFSVHWEESLRDYVARRGQLFPPTGIDYFAFPKGTWDVIPPFAIGRPRWDNWMIYRALELGVPVIDATQVVLAVHQNHDYAHVPARKGETYYGPEAERNWEMAGYYSYVFTLDGANWLLTRRGLVPALAPRHLRQRFNAWLSVHHPHLRAGLNMLRQRLLRATINE